MTGPGNEAGTHTVRMGGEIVLRLDENPTTGYAWEFRQNGSGAVRIIDDDFQPGGSGRPALPGASGQRVVRIIGERTGPVQVEAIERRPWDPPSAEKSRRVFTIVVK